MKKTKELVLRLIKDLEYGNGVEFKKILENAQKEEAVDSQKLKQILNELEEEGLVEKRHFEDGKTDYQLEPPGWEVFNNKLTSKKH